jgi:hypothetical protein
MMSPAKFLPTSAGGMSPGAGAAFDKAETQVNKIVSKLFRVIFTFVSTDQRCYGEDELRATFEIQGNATRSIFDRQAAEKLEPFPYSKK